MVNPQRVRTVSSALEERLFNDTNAAPLQYLLGIHDRLPG